MNSLARARPMRFEWQKLVTPLTNKSVVAEWQRRDSEINARNKEATGVSRTVEPIDWAHWESVISAPGVVAEMKKEYEALHFPKIEPFTEAAKATIASIEEEVVLAKKAAVHGANEVKECEKVVNTVNKLKKEGLEWSMEQWQAFMPGLEAQHKAEYENEDYLVSDSHEKLASTDWKAATKEFVATGNTDLGDADASVGDANLEEEVELVKNGTWSIARLFASKDERAKIQERVEKAPAAAL